MLADDTGNYQNNGSEDNHVARQDVVLNVLVCLSVMRRMTASVDGGEQM